tara:strand:+ start:475 stop:636 length:162 start_codon:yes stop_codon:yes gene_type:complete
MMKLLVVVFVGTAMGFLLIEWASGCGEVTYFPDRTWQSNQCMFLPNETSSGKW